MEKSAVTEFFVKYSDEHRINKVWISEKTGIGIEKLSANYREPLDAEEFFKLCVLLEIEPEDVIEAIKANLGE